MFCCTVLNKVSRSQQPQRLSRHHHYSHGWYYDGIVRYDGTIVWDLATTHVLVILYNWVVPTPIEAPSSMQKERTRSSMCVREETRNTCRQSMSSGMSSRQVRASSHPRRSAIRHCHEVRLQDIIDEQGHVLAGISDSETSRSRVNNLSICSRALDTNPCVLSHEKH